MTFHDLKKDFDQNPIVDILSTIYLIYSINDYKKTIKNEFNIYICIFSKRLFKTYLRLIILFYY